MEKDRKRSKKLKKGKKRKKNLRRHIPQEKWFQELPRTSPAAINCKKVEKQATTTA